MANISLDSQIFFTPLVATGQKPTGRNVRAQNGGVSVTSSRGLEMRQQDAYDRRGGAAGTSQGDAVLISSDDESDHDELDDSRSDISLPPIEELLLRAKRGITGVDFNATSSVSGDSDAKEPSATLGANRDDEPAPSQQQQTRNLKHSPGPPHTPALSRRSSVSPAVLHAEQDRPVPLDGAAYEEERASVSEDTWGKTAEEISHATPSGVESQHVSSPGRLTSPSPGPEGATHRESTLRRDSAVENDSNDEAEPLPVKLRSCRRNAAPHCEIRRPLNTPTVDYDEEDDVEAVQPPNSQDSPRRHLGRRSRAADEDMYHPLKGSEREQSEEDDDNIRLLPSKRRKTSSPTQPTLLRRSTRQQTHSDRGASRSRQARTPVPGQRGSGRRSIPRPPSFQSSGDEVGPVQVPVASFEEWPLQNAVLRQVIIDGMATFQIQFTRDSCANHKRRESAPGNRPHKPPVKRRRPTKRGTVTKLAFTLEEDDLLIKLKKRELSWKEIHSQFTEAFAQRERSIGTLQVRYCTKLKERQSSGGSSWQE
ncbi:hypothetical protein F4824DRAFT_507972 [Ustulina deusta]|nr:hypothetical protein F4824DRAFT_507972 [Ustulina deusta]